MHVISLINMKGGVSKTTLAINIADYLSTKEYKKVLIIDVDPQFNATQCLMSPEDYGKHLQEDKDTIVKIFDRNRPIPSSVGKKEINTVKKLSDISVVSIKENLYLLPGNLDLFRLEMAPGDGRENRLNNYLKKVEDKYDFVIIDTPPTPSVWMTSALIASDYYLIPVKPDPISLTGIDLLKSIIEDKKENYALSIECIGLVLTIVEERTTVFREAKENLKNDDYWKGKLYNSFLKKRIEIAKEQLNRQQILDCSSSEAKLEIRKVVMELLGKIK